MKNKKELYKGYPLHEVKEATKDLRELGVSDKEIADLFEKAQHRFWQDTVTAMGISFTMYYIYHLENGLIKSM